MARSAHCKFVNHVSMYGGLFVGPLSEESGWTQIMKKLISEEECKLGMLLTRTPVPAGDIAKKAGIGEKEAAEMLWNMADHGAIFARFIGDTPHYCLAPFIPGIYEFLLDRRTLDMEMAQLFVDMPKEMAGLMKYVSNDDGGLMKVVPVMKEIKAQQKVLTFEEILHYIEEAECISVTDCLCRTSMKMLGKGCEHPIEDTCMQLGPHARYYIETGRGHEVTKEEAVEILNKVEEAGLVHMVFATEGMGNSSYICNCCGCSCSGFRVRRQYGGFAFSRSNFRAEIDPEKCEACGACVEICPENAIKLGEKLCRTQESQIEKYETSYDTIWGKSKYNDNYRNRVTVTNAGTAPCKTRCPAHISVQGYISKAAEGKYTEALEIIKRDNPFPAVCGRICPHPCETECTRGNVDEALAIDAIKQFIADQERDGGNRFVPRIKSQDDPKGKEGKRVAVIGAGPAGLSCAYYLAIEGYKVTVFEKQKVLGGMLTLGIPSFRLDKDVINAEIETLRLLGVEFVTGVEIGRDKTIEQLRQDGYCAFYIAVGAQKGTSLSIEGEDLPDVISGVDFLRDINLNRGTKLDGPVVVIGGGNVAIDVARSCVRAGAGSVGIFCLESAEEMPALDDERREALEEGVLISNGWGPKRVISENGKVTGVEFKRCVSVFDEDGNFVPKYNEGEIIIALATKVILAIGQNIDLLALNLDGQLAADSRGRLKVSEVSYQTSVPDIFAGGDVVTGPKFAIDAIALGKQGAESIHRYIQGRNLTLCRERDYWALDKKNLDTDGYDHIPRQKAGHCDASAARKTFSDLRLGLTEEQVRSEAERCLRCGISIVDANKCAGCGLCTRKCNFDAIHLVRFSEAAPAETFGEFYARAVKYAVARAGRIAVKGIRGAFSGGK